MANGRVQVFLPPFLLYHHLRGGNIAVYERGMLKVDLGLELDKGGIVLHTEDMAQQVYPELLALAFLIASVRPLFLEQPRRLLNIVVLHR